MAKAGRLVLSTSEPGNEPAVDRLSLNQTAAALTAMLKGAQQIPTIGDLRSMVRRGLRARRIAAKGGRRHG